MAKKRKNGQGTVRKRADGRWEGRHIIGYTEDGKAITKSVLAKTKTACVEKLKKLQAEHVEVAPSKIKPDNCCLMTGRNFKYGAPVFTSRQIVPRWRKAKGQRPIKVLPFRVSPSTFNMNEEVAYGS